MERSIDIAVSVTTADLINQLTWGLSTDELVAFVTVLDDMAGDWDFSEACYGYFKAQHKRYKEKNND